MADASESPEIPAEEVERLRAENAALKKRLNVRPDATSEEHTGHRWLSVTCAVLAAMFLLASVVTVWVRTTVLNTDQYVATVTPLAQNEDIQNAVAGRVTDEISKALDIKSVAEEALPNDAAVLAGPIASGAENLIDEVVVKLLQTKEFERIWEDANRTSHEVVVKVLTGDASKGGVVSAADGKIVIDLAPLVDQILKELGNTFGTDLTSKVDTSDVPLEFTVIDSPDLASAQTELRWFDALSWATLILAVVFLLGTVLLAGERRIGMRRLGLSVVISMVIAGLLYTFARNEYAAGVADLPNPAAAEAVFDILTRFLQRSIRVLFTVGALILVGVWVVGPSNAAARVRTWWDTLLGRASVAGADREVGPVPRWIAAHERSLRIAIAVLTVLAIVLWTRPTGLVVLLIVIVALLVAAGIRLVAEVARRAEADEAESADDDRSDSPDEVKETAGGS